VAHVPRRLVMASRGNSFAVPRRVISMPTLSAVNKMSLRFAIYAQLSSVVLIGLFTRGIVTIPPWIVQNSLWIVGLFNLLVMLAFFGFPVVVLRCLLRQRLPGWKSTTVLGIELAITFAYFIALLPAIQ
jgi:hypothetical protein